MIELDCRNKSGNDGLWEKLTHPCHYPACPGNPDCYASSMEKVYYVYLLASERNGRLYVGVTNDLVRRIYEHKSGAIDGFSKQYGVKKLVWFEQTINVHAAIAREKRIKKISARIEDQPDRRKQSRLARPLHDYS